MPTWNILKWRHSTVHALYFLNICCTVCNIITALENDNLFCSSMAKAFVNNSTLYMVETVMLLCDVIFELCSTALQA